MSRLCDRIKAAGITMYTITFGVSTDPNNATRQLFQRCANQQRALLQ